MKSSTLKILACLFMLIDHVGYVFFPRMMVLRIIGRLAFPIFAYMIAEGYRKTSDVTKYMGRLFLFALISQIPFLYAFRPKGLYLNVFFTLVMGLYALYIYDKEKKLYIVVIIAVVCEFANTDYGGFGVFLIFLFNRYHDDFKGMVKSAIILTAVYQSFQGLMFGLTSPQSQLINNLTWALVIQPISLLSLILIKLYNKERGLKLKYFFYAFYPVHLGIIALINYIR